MRREVLVNMSDLELESYMDACGVEAPGGATVEEKAALIEEARARVADLTVLGERFAVPIRRVRDKRVVDLLNAETDRDAAYEQAARAVLGDEQFDRLVGLCTDEDGVVDVAALGIGIASVFASGDLKN